MEASLAGMGLRAEPSSGWQRALLWVWLTSSAVGVLI